MPISPITQIVLRSTKSYYGGVEFASCGAVCAEFPELDATFRIATRYLSGVCKVSHHVRLYEEEGFAFPIILHFFRVVRKIAD